MSDRLRNLIDQPAPGEREAEQRSYELVRAAFEERHPLPRRQRRRTLVLALAVALLLVALAVTPAGGALTDLIRDGLDIGREPSSPALVSLPGGGSLAVDSQRGAWVVHSDGAKRLLGSYERAYWSPHGLFLAAVRGRELTAVTPTGEVRWSLARANPIVGPRWAPSGFRIAYLTGDSLRVVAGDGTDDRLLSNPVAPVAPAWKPTELRNVLAFARLNGSIEVRNADTGRRIWRSSSGEVPRQLAWSDDGRRLIALAEHSLRVFDQDGGLLSELHLRAGQGAKGALGSPQPPFVDFAPSGHGFVLIRSSRGAGQSEVVLLRAEADPGRPRRLFAGLGHFVDPLWSPNGRWLLIGWQSADQWLFLGADGTRSITAVSKISRQFDPGGAGRGRFPRVTGWSAAD